ncbi:hypothetical protein [Mycolicibacterium fallax]|uniref:hypothetical protein n=1 Tax=Mycolicibacterium fallax TaxID=1793 RepID=UPI0021F2A679|nr:hypothetical protein [Mycolicibacterium fallax]
MATADIPPPVGRAAGLLGVPALFPQVSETGLDSLAVQDDGIAAAGEEYGNWLRSHRDHTADLLEGAAGDADQESVTRLMNYVFHVTDWYRSRAQKRRDYSAAVRGTKHRMVSTVDAAEQDLERAEKMKVPGGEIQTLLVERYSPEMESHLMNGLGEVASATQPGPPPTMTITTTPSTTTPEDTGKPVIQTVNNEIPDLTTPHLGEAPTTDNPVNPTTDPKGGINPTSGRHPPPTIPSTQPPIQRAASRT